MAPVESPECLCGFQPAPSCLSPLFTHCADRDRNEEFARASPATLEGQHLLASKGRAVKRTRPQSDASARMGLLPPSHRRHRLRYRCPYELILTTFDHSISSRAHRNPEHVRRRWSLNHMRVHLPTRRSLDYAPLLQVRIPPLSPEPRGPSPSDLRLLVHPWDGLRRPLQQFNVRQPSMRPVHLLRQAAAANPWQPS